MLSSLSANAYVRLNGTEYSTNAEFLIGGGAAAYVNDHQNQESLTLRDVTLDFTEESPDAYRKGLVYGSGSLHLYIKGNCKLICRNAPALVTNRALRITCLENATLEITTTNTTYAIQAEGELFFKDCNLTINNLGSGVTTGTKPGNSYLYNGFVSVDNSNIFFNIASDGIPMDYAKDFNIKCSYIDGDVTHKDGYFCNPDGSQYKGKLRILPSIGVMVAGKRVTLDNCDDVMGDGTVRYEPGTRTLVLDEANIHGDEDNHALEISAPTNIRVDSYSYLETTGQHMSPLYIHDCDVTITSPGGSQLDMCADYANCLHVIRATLTLDGTDINAYTEWLHALCVEDGALLATNSNMYLECDKKYEPFYMRNSDCTLNGIELVSPTDVFYDQEAGIYRDLTGSVYHGAMEFRAEGTRLVQPAGNGKSSDPYRIGTASELFWFANLVNGRIEGKTSTMSNVTARAILTDDIDMSQVLHWKSWTPIAYRATDSDGYYSRFAGTLDGQGHTISHFDVSSDYDCMGLFGYLAGKVMNLNIEGNVQGTANTGMIAGDCTGTITGCTVSGTVKSQGGENVGGLVGLLEDQTGIIQNCVNNATVQSDARYTGGIAGRATNWSTITDCANHGIAYATTTADSPYLGGIAGSTVATVSNCYNMGSGLCLKDGKQQKVYCISYPKSGELTNCYYLPQVGATNIGDAATAVTYNQLASGEVAYKLGTAWGQEIGVDDYPVPGGMKVYQDGDTYTNTQTTVTGDVNGDGTVSIKDVVAVLEAMASDSKDLKYDVNDDGSVSIKDVVAVLEIMAGQ